MNNLRKAIIKANKTMTGEPVYTFTFSLAKLDKDGDAHPDDTWSALPSVSSTFGSLPIYTDYSKAIEAASRFLDRQLKLALSLGYTLRVAPKHIDDEHHEYIAFCRVRAPGGGNSIVMKVRIEGIVPDFTATTTDVALGSSVDFIDHTWGTNLVSWEWSFEGGEPATSNVQNPSGITYNAIGHYDVTLSVTNAEGQTETVVKHNYIQVTESYFLQNATYETCNALFYDDGGPNAN